MIVHPKQLIPGCLLTKDIMGKTNRPIVPKNTVLNDIHITILNKFLIESVEVSPNLTYGSPFIPENLMEEETNNQEKDNNKESEVEINTLSFQEQYLDVVTSYKQLFLNWQSGSAIDISKVRKVIVPLLDRIDDVGLDLFLLHQLSTKKDYFYHHGVAISLISAYLAKKRGLKKEWIQVGLAGLLADCGMAKINWHLFNKQGKLSIPEYDEIKKHPTYSYRFIEKIPSLSVGAKLAVLQHHEYLDGSGYPLGVKKNKIHYYAFIVAISDSYHAMTSERPYKKKRSPFIVIEEMMQDQFDKYDHEVLQTFVKCLANFSAGMRVKLSDDTYAEIVFVEEKHPTRPMVRLAGSNEIISLKDKKDIFIVDIIS